MTIYVELDFERIDGHNSGSKLSSFTTLLPNALTLKRDWQVSLIDISWQSSVRDDPFAADHDRDIARRPATVSMRMPQQISDMLNQQKF